MFSETTKNLIDVWHNLSTPAILILLTIELTPVANFPEREVKVLAVAANPVSYSFSQWLFDLLLLDLLLHQ